MTRVFFAGLVLGTCWLPLSGVSAGPSSGLDALVQLLGQVDDAQFQLDLLQGMHDALEGRRNLKMPAGWTAVYAKLSRSSNGQVRDKAQVLALIFGDPQAVEALRRIASDQSSDPQTRRRAIGTLAQNNAANLAELLLQLLDDKSVRTAALRGLAFSGDPRTPAAIVSRYSTLDEAEKSDAIQTLAARPAYARAMLEAIESGKIPSRDVSAFTARQLQNLGDADITARLAKLWGTVRGTSEDKKVLIGRYKKVLTPDRLEQANLGNGRLLFKRTCSQCHILYGDGGKIGPNITGSNRNNLDYILENIVDPSAAVARDYKMKSIITDDGRIIAGLVMEESNRTLTVQTLNDRVVLDKSAIDEVQTSAKSMMPDGLLDKLNDAEVRDLIAYLGSKSQVPLPAEQ